MDLIRVSTVGIVGILKPNMNVSVRKAIKARTVRQVIISLYMLYRQGTRTAQLVISLKLQSMDCRLESHCQQSCFLGTGL